MSQFSTWLPSRRQLQQHLARLVDTLEALVQRLRESIARTVGEAVANAVHEVTHRLEPAAPEAPQRGPAGTSANRRWDDPYESDWDDEPGLRPRPLPGGRCAESPPEAPAVALASMPWPWAARPRPGGWPGKSAAIPCSLPPAWA